MACLVYIKSWKLVESDELKDLRGEVVQTDDKRWWLRVLRLIINLIPTNAMQRRLPRCPSKHMGYAPLWGQVVLLEGEVMLFYAEDQKHCFHIFGVEPCWRAWFVLNKKASAQSLGLSGPRVRPRVCSAPMGWSNIVDFIQDSHIRMADVAGAGARHRIEHGRALPMPDLVSGRQWFSIYVDNFDGGKVVSSDGWHVWEGRPDDVQLKLREEFTRHGISRDPQKSAEGSITWKSLGAEVDGLEGTVEAQRVFRRAVAGSNVDLVLGDFSVSATSTDFLSTISRNVHSLQFSRPLSCLLQCSFAHMHDQEARHLGANVGDELLSLTCSLPLQVTSMRMKFDPRVYATDASNDGAGACVSYELSDQGLAMAQAVSTEPTPEASRLLVIEHFAGMGGAKKALDLLGVSPLGVITVENDKLARKVCKHSSPFSWMCLDVHAVTKDTVREWRRIFKAADEVLNIGGWPCYNHSSLNAHRDGTEADSPKQLDVMLQIATWLREVASEEGPPWEVRECYENVLMDFEDLLVQSQKIGCFPTKWDAKDCSWCSRPRLLWLKNIPLVFGADLSERRQQYVDLVHEGLSTNLSEAWRSKKDIRIDAITVKSIVPPLEKFLDNGAWKLKEPETPFFTFVRTIPRQAPPPKPAGIERWSEKGQEEMAGRCL